MQYFNCNSYKVSLPNWATITQAIACVITAWIWLTCGHRCSLNTGGFELFNHTIYQLFVYGSPPNLDPFQMSHFYQDSKHTTITRLILAGKPYTHIVKFFFLFLLSRSWLFILRNFNSRKKCCVVNIGLGLEFGNLGLNPSLFVYCHHWGFTSPGWLF